MLENIRVGGHLRCVVEGKSEWLAWLNPLCFL